jgi:hypothetical protein
MVNYLVNNNNKGGAAWGHMLGCCAYHTLSRGQMPKLCGFVEIKLGGRKLGKRVWTDGERQLLQLMCIQNK